MSTRLAAAALALAGLGFFAPAGGQDMSGPCQDVSGQYEVNGTLQLVSGLACLQPDGTWQIVSTNGAGVDMYAVPYYYDYPVDPWYWAPFGYGAVIFIDHHHHVHHVSHVFMPRPGAGFHGGFHGGMGGFHGGMGGGFHGNGGGFPGNGGGGFHGGGGHR